jgi:hypothetical protein
MHTGTPTISPAGPSPTEPPERSPHTAPRRPQQTSNDAQVPAESVRVTDRPTGQGGRAYLVERGLETKGELDAVVADYLGQAAKLDCPPVAVCPLESMLEVSA